MKKHEVRIPSTEESVGTLLTLGGAISYVVGSATQAKVDTAFKIKPELGEAVYQELVKQYSQLGVDYAISYGEDVGALIAAYGLMAITNDSLFAHALKWSILVGGVGVELAQKAGFDNGTFSPVDLAIYAIPLTLELAKLGYERYVRD
jgi:hypothetical protein